MPILNITDIKVVSPSPNNFILDLEISGKHYNYIASGEQIYQNTNNIDSSLLNEHVAHSSIFKINNNLITAYSLFDMNDMGITTDDEDIDNLLLMPNANTIAYERDLSSNLIPMHSINSNAVYGYVRTELSSSFGFPIYDKTKQKFLMGTHNKNAYSDPTDPKSGTTDTLTLYRYRNNATNISGVLGLGKQADISAANLGFDKLFVFDPTNDNNIRAGNTVRNWRSYQTNRPFAGGFTNNFDDSLLLARAILFPKQTLNNEYSTEREYVPSSEVSAPFQQTRKYNWNTDKYFYSNGTHIILNHRDDTKFAFGDDTNKRGGTMVTSTYSRRFSDEKPKEHLSPQPPNGEEEIIALDTGEKVIAELDYNKYGTFTFENSNISSVSGLYNQYSPELINRENETMSDTALMTSRHKTNIFDIEFTNGLWNDIAKAFKTEENKEAYAQIKENLKESIRLNLFKLVEEIKPAHTELYKITFDPEEETEILPPKIWVDNSYLEDLFVCPESEDQATGTFTVFGSNLSNPIHLEISDTEISNYFTLTPTEIELPAGRRNFSQECTIAFHPTEDVSIGNEIPCVITITNDDVKDPVIVHVKGFKECPPEGLSANKSILSFDICEEAVQEDESVSLTFNVKGKYLKNNVSVTIDDTNNYYTISQSIIAPEGPNFEVDKDITVTFKPDKNTAQLGVPYLGEVVCKSSPATSVSVSLSGIVNECCEPTINLNDSSIDLNPICPGAQTQGTFTISGTCIHSPIYFSMATGDKFNINPSSISPVDRKIQSTTITVTFNAPNEGQSGETFNDTIQISSTEIDMRTINVTGTIDCCPEVSLEPEMIEFTPICQGSSTSETVTLNARTCENHIISLSTDRNEFEVSPQSITPVQNKVTDAQITVTFNAPDDSKPLDIYTGNLIATSSDFDEPQTVELNASVDKTCCDPEIEISKDELIFNNICAGDSSTQTFNITGSCLWDDNVDIAVSGSQQFSVSPNTLTPDVNGQVNEDITVTFNCPNEANNTPYTGSINVSYNGETYGNIDLSGTGQVCWRLTDISCSRGRDPITGNESWCTWRAELPELNICKYGTLSQQIDDYASEVSIFITGNSNYAPIIKGTCTETTDYLIYRNCSCRCTEGNQGLPYDNPPKGPYPSSWTADTCKSKVGPTYTSNRTIATYTYSRDTCDQSTSVKDVIIEFKFEKCIPIHTIGSLARPLQSSPRWKLIGFSRSNITENEINFYQLPPNVENSTYKAELPESQSIMIMSLFAPFDVTNNIDCTIETLSVEWCRDDDIPATENNAQTCNIIYGIMSNNTLVQTCTFTYQKEGAE